MVTHGRHWAHGHISSAFKALARQQMACAVENDAPLASVALCLPVHLVAAGLDRATLVLGLGCSDPEERHLWGRLPAPIS